MSTFLERTDGFTTVPPKRGTFNRVSAAAVRRNPVRIYALLITTAAGAAVSGFVLGGFTPGPPLALVVLILIGWYAESQTIRISATMEVCVSSTLYVFAGVLFGPVAAAIVGGASLLTVLREHGVESPFLRWAVWTSSRVVVATAAGAAAYLVEGGNRHDPLRLMAAVVVASIADLLLDAVLAPIPPVLRRRTQWRDEVRNLLPMQAAALPVHAPLIGLLAYVYVNVSPWSVALFVLPVIAAQRLLMLYLHERAASEALGVANQQLSAANLSFATALVATLEARDRYTAGHSAAVSVYARDIAARLGLSVEDQHKARLCGLVHDIGKVGLPAGLLEKAGALTAEEHAQMQSHPAIGQRILERIGGYEEIALIVRHHHERIDGLGYPDSLRGAEIPLISRIIAVADAYNAMTSDRPYRRALRTDEARLRLASAVGTQFDTTVVAAFEAILATATPTYRDGTHDEFALDGSTLDGPGASTAEDAAVVTACVAA